MGRSLTAAAAIILGLASNAVADPFTSATNNIALYWGQNSYGSSTKKLEQQALSYYCANTNVNVIQMAFMDQVTSGEGGLPVLNFANSGNACTTFPGTELLDCPTIGKAITTCQQKYGKTILLSIGGSTYTEGGFANASQAHTYASLIWAMFGPEQTGSTALRPFGAASVDGFDFDFESAVTNTVPFATKLRNLMDANTSRTFYLTAAPQCPYPDLGTNSMLNGGVPFDAVYVQFYNNYCGLQSYTAGSTTQNNFDFGTWQDWAVNGSANPDVKIFLGVPAGPTAAGSGYEPAASLKPIIKYSKTFANFGGVMMWDASQAYANTGFIKAVKTALGSGASKKKRASRARDHVKQLV